jgi:hypothetical protein
MDIKKHKFPELSGVDIAFPILGADPALLAEAKERGFYCGRTPYNTLFSKLFFSGGTLDFKTDLDPIFKAKALPYLKALSGSFSLKHEEKEAICSLLLSELCNY